MRYHALACDYDGTLAKSGEVSPATVAALKRVRDSGRKLLLVTGRQINDLRRVFSELALFDRVVAENGALLYRPATREERLLGDPPPHDFVQALKSRRVTSLSQGRVIVATCKPHEIAALEVIRDLGLELQVIFNKDAVMILPTGVNKASGLEHALSELQFSAHNTVGIGDAENDHAFLNLCECAAAVGNAVPVIKKHVDFVAEGTYGEGVVELAERLVEDDLVRLESRLTRHHILFGSNEDNKPVGLPAFGRNVMISGPSGGGKSTVALGLLERLADQRYQYCIFDPEGDYAELDNAVVLGDHQRPPNPNEVMDVLFEPTQDAVINLMGISIEHRPDFFMGLLRRIQALRDETGRPHWLLIDEAHHLLPAARPMANESFMKGMLMITVHPDRVSRGALSTIDTLIAIGDDARKTIHKFAERVNASSPEISKKTIEPGDAMIWLDRSHDHAIWARSAPPTIEKKRHDRKYMAGELAPQESFYFTGPEQNLNLRAQNLHMFVQLAEGLDDATWSYHLERGDYAKWFRQALKDEDLASETEGIDSSMSPRDSRALVKAKIEARYTAPE
jgi:hydroxymethylpyrimidine pyrophosphatase-like HAD family hydrolase